MPRPNRGGEKPKNFKTAIIRLFTELKTFHVAIITAIILTTVSSILSSHFLREVAWEDKET